MSVTRSNDVSGISGVLGGYAPLDSSLHIPASYVTGGGDLVLLESHTASSSASLDFTAFISSTYDTYVFELVSIVLATTDVNLWLRAGTGGGPTYDSGANYSYDGFVWRAGGTGTGGATAQNQIVLDYTGGSDKIRNTTAALAGVQGSFTLWDPQSTALYRQLRGSVSYFDSANFRVTNDVRGSYETTTALTAVRFMASSGNITSGTIRVYGVTKTSSVGSPQTTKAPDGKPWNYTPPIVANIMDDEFGDASGQSGPSNGLNAKWSKHNLGTSTWLKLDDTYAPGCLAFDIPTGQTTDQWIYQAVPSGNFTVMCRFSQLYGDDRQMWGLAILDTNGTGIGVRMDATGTSGGQVFLMDITTWQQTGSVTNGVPDLQVTYPQTLPVSIWLEYAGGTAPASINFAITENDRAFYNLLQKTNRTRSFTPAYVAFGRSFGTGVSKMTLDFFRRTA